MTIQQLEKRIKQLERKVRYLCCESSQTIAGATTVAPETASYTTPGTEDFLFVRITNATFDTVIISSADIANPDFRIIISDEGFTSPSNPLTIQTEGAEEINGNVANITSIQTYLTWEAYSTGIELITLNTI